MVDWGRAHGRAETWTEKTWAENWPQPGRALPWAPRLPDLSHLVARWLAPWLAAEVAPGRLMPWQS